MGFHKFAFDNKALKIFEFRLSNSNFITSLALIIYPLSSRQPS